MGSCSASGSSFLGPGSLTSFSFNSTQSLSSQVRAAGVRAPRGRWMRCRPEGCIDTRSAWRRFVNEVWSVVSCGVSFRLPHERSETGRDVTHEGEVVPCDRPGALKGEFVPSFQCSTGGGSSCPMNTEGGRGCAQFSVEGGWWGAQGRPRGLSLCAACLVFAPRPPAGVCGSWPAATAPKTTIRRCKLSRCLREFQR